MVLKVQHECMLENENVIFKLIDSGIFINVRRALVGYVMVNKHHPHSALYFKSSHDISNEQKRHLIKYRYKIHPYSSFSLHWTYIFTVALLYFYLFLPFHMGMPLAHAKCLDKILATFQVIHFIHVIITFFTGYYDERENYVILSTKKIAVRYIKTYLIFDCLSILPAILIWEQFYDVHVILELLAFFLVFKLARMNTLLQCSVLIKHHMELHDYIYTLIKFFVVFIGSVLWVYCLVFFIRFNRWSASYFDFFVNLEQVLQVLMLRGVDNDAYYTVSFGSLMIFLGFILHLILLVWLAEVWQKFNSTIARQERFSREIYEYGRHASLPQKIRKRINLYVAFKHQGEYIKESALPIVISDNLRTEVNVCKSRFLIDKVELFKELPDAILNRLCKYLRPEIYLPGDIILSAGKPGNAMYFIVHGNVNVTTLHKKPVCILRDGSYFGEIALVLGIPRIATVIAITACELLMLKRHHFLDVFKHAQHLLVKVTALATYRMLDTRLQDVLRTDSTNRINIDTDAINKQNQLLTNPRLIDDDETLATVSVDSDSEILSTYYDKAK